MKGADRESQELLEGFSSHLELYDIETGTEVYRRGTCTLDPMQRPEHPKQIVAKVLRQAARERRLHIDITP